MPPLSTAAYVSILFTHAQLVVTTIQAHTLFPLAHIHAAKHTTMINRIPC